jgi:hypothetical protein
MAHHKIHCFTHPSFPSEALCSHSLCKGISLSISTSSRLGSQSEGRFPNGAKRTSDDWSDMAILMDGWPPQGALRRLVLFCYIER